MNQVRAQSDAQSARVDAADAKVKAGLDLVNQTTSLANNMLDVLQHFDAKALGSFVVLLRGGFSGLGKGRNRGG